MSVFLEDKEVRFREQLVRLARALDLQFGDPEVKFRPDR